jgi:hypothetical protein
MKKLNRERSTTSKAKQGKPSDSRTTIPSKKNFFNKKLTEVHNENKSIFQEGRIILKAPKKQNVKIK